MSAFTLAAQKDLFWNSRPAGWPRMTAAPTAADTAPDVGFAPRAEVPASNAVGAILSLSSDRRLAAVEAALTELVSSSEPAVVFISAAALCAAILCDECSVSIVEAGQLAYRIRRPLRDTDSARRDRSPRGQRAGARVLLDAGTLVIPVRSSGRGGHPGYAGAFVLAWRDGHRPDFSAAAAARAVVERASALIEHTRLAEKLVGRRDRPLAPDGVAHLTRHPGSGHESAQTVWQHSAATDARRTRCQATPYRIELKVRDARIDLRLHGEIDMASAAHLTRILAPLDTIAAAIGVDLSEVSFLDSSGIEPVVAFDRARTIRGLPPIQVTACSTPARRLLLVSRLGGDPGLDVDAWDHLSARTGGRGLAAWCLPQAVRKTAR